MRTRKWQDKDGQDRYTTEVIADTMQMLGGRGGGGQGMDEGSAPSFGARGEGESRAPAKSPGVAKKPAASFEDMDDDIPF